MHRPWNFVGLTADSMVSGYGYGLLWQRDSLGRVYVGHNGGLPGFGSNWYMMPEYGLGVILFANVTYAPAFKVNLKVLDQLIVEAGLKPRQLPPSKILKERQNELLKSIPHWEVKTDVFAKNFFLDRSLDWLKEESTRLFSKVGKIALVGDLIAENQLRGYFIVTGERGDLRIDFGLTPENPSLIQYYQIKEVVK
jgi:CubicO group peptidase (beta-lactamase class C family)